MSIASFTEPVEQMALVNALLDRLNSPDGLGGMVQPRKAWRRDKAPKTGGDYVILDVLRTAGGNRRLGGGIAPSSWYASVTAVGANYNNASMLLHYSTLALIGFEITVGDDESTGIDFDGSMESPIQQDDDDLTLWSGSRTFSFAF